MGVHMSLLATKWHTNNSLGNHTFRTCVGIRPQFLVDHVELQSLRAFRIPNSSRALLLWPSTVRVRLEVGEVKDASATYKMHKPHSTVDLAHFHHNDFHLGNAKHDGTISTFIHR